MYTRRRLPSFEFVCTHMAFGHDASFFVKGRDFVRAVPGTVLTADTTGVIVPDDAVVKFDVRLCRAPFKTLRFYTVVAAHRVEELQGIWKLSHLHLTYTTPFDVVWVCILFVTGYLTTVTAYTGSGIKVETVLLCCFKFRQVDTVVAALHACVGFVVDEV